VTAPNSPYRLYFSNLLAKLKASGRAVAFKERADIPDEAVTVDGVIDKLVIWGSPKKVADDLLAFRNEVGDFGTLLYAGKDWLDRDLGRRSMVLMAEQVLPALGP
jgi:alkanesulfonate monooxygenase SsuD/methylene tetrahydromethanopterin reductase-like flavin-dependent oxidoreductase (luciferase family)